MVAQRIRIHQEDTVLLTASQPSLALRGHSGAQPGTPRAQWSLPSCGGMPLPATITFTQGTNSWLCSYSNPSSESTWHPFLSPTLHQSPLPEQFPYVVLRTDCPSALS